jgi:DNA-nicking Smr family endonuclease
MRDVDTLAGRDEPVPEEGPQAPAGKRPAGRRPAAPTGARKDALPDLSHGAAPGVDKRTALRLKRGQLTIERRIDLHGLTQEEAHRALVAFVHGAAEAGRRCVLVITGKGGRGDGEVGVLRAAVPEWLNGPELRRDVLAFSHAAAKDGGAGALYVLLRRRR